MTRKEKIKIYIQARVEIYDNEGLCFALMIAARAYGYDSCFQMGFLEMEKYFPEVYKHKPDTMFNNDYWFDPADKKSRLNILNKALIELTTPEPVPA